MELLINLSGLIFKNKIMLGFKKWEFFKLKKFLLMMVSLSFFLVFRNYLSLGFYDLLKSQLIIF